ncbi:MAG: methyltransferase domain-containing protein [Marinicaulis sp.]|nr:methyltransferase domain-containing protein [Marinicaulis sp.]NNE41713.1 methyltransferase domain-containing protein [Marinicaulis sp.]NNL87786.1 methyltransferase domain-containing protein [Marinicaulis sp.]
MKKITSCRACGSKALTPAFSILLGAAPRKMWRNGKENVEYLLCDPSRDSRACGLLQSAVPNAYEDTTPSGRHSSTREHLRAVATESLELISGRDCSALDIGCNDGTLLSYYPRWVDRHGVDPAAPVDEIGEWAWTAREAFPSSELDSAFGKKKFDIISAVSVFEYIDDPRAMLARIKLLLAEDGVFALETLYSPMVLTRNSVEALQSGVSAVYSLSALEWLIREADLKIFKGTLTTKEGGSIRLFITHKDNDEFDFDPWYERLAKLWDEENALAMRSIQPYQTFERRAEDIQERFVTLLDEIASRGECAQILGADSQTDALLRWAGRSAKVVTAVVDTHVSRENETLGEKGPRIISETDCRAAEPDYLIAPARYKRELLERWREAILLGARLIFVTPQPHIVDASNFATEYGKSLEGGDSGSGVETLRSILAASGGPRLVADNGPVKKAAEAS